MRSRAVTVQRAAVLLHAVPLQLSTSHQDPLGQSKQDADPSEYLPGGHTVAVQDSSTGRKNVNRCC